MNATTEVALFQLWHRPPGKNQRWHKAGRFGSRAEALNAIGSGGDWRVEELNSDCEERREEDHTLFTEGQSNE